MNTESIFVDLQGFKDYKNNFIVKEFALATADYTQVFLIKPPFPFRKLTDAEKKQVLWLGRNRGIYWGEGLIGYKEFQQFIKSHLVNKTLIVKGLEKVKWVEKLCPSCTVKDIGDKEIPNLKKIISYYYTNQCSKYNCLTHNDYCALKNVLCLKKWCLENKLVI